MSDSTGCEQEAHPNKMAYLEIIYYYDAVNDIWNEISGAGFMLEPGMLLNMKMTHDCIWIF